MSDEYHNPDNLPVEFLCDRCKGYGLLGDDPSGQNLSSCPDCDESGLKLVFNFCDEGAKFDMLLRSAEGYRRDALFYKGERHRTRINRALLAEHRAEMMVS